MGRGMKPAERDTWPAAALRTSRRAYLRYPDANHPSVQRVRVIGAQELDVLRRLGLLQFRVLDGEAKLGRGLVLLLPADAIVNLEQADF